MDAYRDSINNEIAAVAARLVVEEGLEYAAAKRRAVKQLGLNARTALPDNATLDAAVREYIAVFCPETQAVELQALRDVALLWMGRLSAFRPHLGGAVWHGTATRHSDIYIQLFCDDPKSAELALLDHRVEYHPGTVNGWRGEPVDVTMGHVNVIWQGDANAQALRCLAAATVPTSPLNVSGPETTSIRWLAQEFARRFGKPVEITGEEAPTAWLMNTGEAERLFGYPRIALKQMMGWVAEWVAHEQRMLGKPTKFEKRDGKY